MLSTTTTFDSWRIHDDVEVRGHWNSHAGEASATCRTPSPMAGRLQNNRLQLDQKNGQLAQYSTHVIIASWTAARECWSLWFLGCECLCDSYCRPRCSVDVQLEVPTTRFQIPAAIMASLHLSSHLQAPLITLYKFSDRSTYHHVLIRPPSNLQSDSLVEIAT